jgi:ABC-type Mn2+/Zn2+ transport system permease subunit
LFIWLIWKRTGLPVEALTAVVFSFSLALAFFFLTTKHVKTALIGDITQVRLPMTLMSLLLCTAIFLSVKKMAPKIVLLSISRDLGKSRMIKSQVINFIYLMSVAVLIALGVRIVGGLMTAALVAIPACTSRNLIHANLYGYMFLSMAFGVLSCGIGILLYVLTGINAGPLIIIVSSVFFAGSLIFSHRRI